MKFTLIIETNNAAVSDDPEGEISRMLTETAELVRGGHIMGTLRDINGNAVGNWAALRQPARPTA